MWSRRIASAHLAVSVSCVGNRLLASVPELSTSRDLPFQSAVPMDVMGNEPFFYNYWGIKAKFFYPTEKFSVTSRR